MKLPIDIFWMGTDGRPIWVEAASNVEDANARVRELAVRQPGEYFLLNQRTQAKSFVKPKGPSGGRTTNSGV